MQMPREVRREIIERIVKVLKTLTVISYDVPPNDPLARYLTDRYPFVLEQLKLPPERVALALLLEGAARDEGVMNEKMHRPLASARYLLALAAPYEDVSAILPDVGMSIAGLRGSRTKVGQDPVRFVGLRRELAAKAGRFGEVADGTVFNSVAGLRRVAEPLVAEIERLIDQGDWSIVERRLEMTDETRVRYKAWVDSTSEVEIVKAAHRLAFADELDRAPRTYPPHLILTGLLENLETRRHPIASNDDSSSAQSSRRLFVLGGPGAGKTTFARANLALHLRAGYPGAYVFLPDLARHLQRERVANFDELLDAIEQTMMLAPKLPEPTFRSELRLNANFGLVLDGLDEVSQKTYSRLVDALSDLNSAFVGTIWLTSRFAGFEKPYAAGTTEIVGLKSPEAFFRSWWPDGGDELAGIEAQLVIDHQVRELAKLPVVAGLMAAAGGAQSSRNAVYHAYLDAVGRRIWKVNRRRDPIEIATIQTTVANVAWSMATRPAASKYQSSEWTDLVTLREAVEDVGPSREQALRAIVMDDGLVVPHDPLAETLTSSAQYVWIHRSLHEYLVGMYLVSSYQQNPERALELVETALMSEFFWIQSLEYMAEAMNEDALRKIRDLVRAVCSEFVYIPDLRYRFWRIAKLDDDESGHFSIQLENRNEVPMNSMQVSLDQFEKFHRVFEDAGEVDTETYASDSNDLSEATVRFSEYPGTQLATLEQHKLLLRSLHSLRKAPREREFSAAVLLWRELLLLDDAQFPPSELLLDSVEDVIWLAADRLTYSEGWQAVWRAMKPRVSDIKASYPTRERNQTFLITFPVIFDFVPLGPGFGVLKSAQSLREEGLDLPDELILREDPNEIMEYVVQAGWLPVLTPTSRGWLADMLMKVGSLLYWRRALSGARTIAGE